MNWLLQLNPAKHLFGRIFLWFWVTLILVVTVTAFTTREIARNQQGTITELNENQQRWLQESQPLLTRLPMLLSQARDLTRALERFGKRNRQLFVLLRQRDNQLISGIPLRDIGENTIFVRANASDEVVALRLRHFEFIGPVTAVFYNGEEYSLFLGRMVPPNPLREVRDQYPLALLSIALLLSALPCFLLARSLVMPLTALGRHARQMGAGNLQAKDIKTALRSDEIGQLAREFNVMATHLEDMMERQKRMISDISHELRSPLTRMQFAVTLAENEFGEAHPLCKRISKEANQLDTMLGQLLALARLENQQSLRFEHFQSNDMLSQILQDAAFEADAAHKNFNHNEGESVLLYGDPVLIASALENILRNAIKYAHEKVKLRTVKDNEVHWQVIIEDDGPGVADAHLTKLFTPFYRTSEARDRDSGGAGLGLAIAARAIYAHGGEIKASHSSSLGGLRIDVSLSIERER
ncbi:ATP-binding protein [Aestuariibacter salexigens]|uniref:ATP-binding protein n=1 Tax=Aestuariibacter salexigens TaxID=226010 RepID=UPI00040C8A03|nr:ATP-binding protein [Aestuariibacter salexigens]